MWIRQAWKNISGDNNILIDVGTTLEKQMIINEWMIKSIISFKEKIKNFENYVKF